MLGYLALSGLILTRSVEPLNRGHFVLWGEVSQYVRHKILIRGIWFTIEGLSWLGRSLGCGLLPRLRSPVGLMTVKEQQLEGKLRYVNSRVITNRLDSSNLPLYFLVIFCIFCNLPLYSLYFPFVFSSNLPGNLYH